MKVCVTSTGSDLNALIDPRFGRCMVFLFIDTETMEFEAVANPAATAGGGAGTKAAQIVADKGAIAVLTGNVGPNAYSALDAAGIKIYVGLSGSCKEAVDKFKNSKLETTAAPSVGRHAGMK